MRKSLTKKEILRRKKDIDRVFRDGKKISTSGIKLHYAKGNGLTYSRVFITLVRKFGNSIERNRAKRIIKEAYRLVKPELPPGWDMAFVLFPCPGSFDFFEQSRNLNRLLQKAGIFSDGGKGSPSPGT